MNGLIRIIGGKWRGRKLPVLEHDGLRPTTDRVKETLFNWLMPIIHDASCIDCFSGSGSLAFEALSRGAKQAVLIEKNKMAATQLSKNSQILQASNIAIFNTDLFSWLEKGNSNTPSFDIAFIDPPFHQQLVQKSIMCLENNNWLNDGAYIYVEAEKNSLQHSQIPQNWHLHREKVTGQVHSYLFIRETI